MKKYFLFFSLLILLSGSYAQAVCPVCTIAVGAGVGVSRWLGIDDTISGLWIGGLIVSMIMWTLNWLDKKNIRFAGKEILTVLAYYAIVIWPLFWLKIGGTTIMGHPLNKMWGIDKLLLGIIIGSIAFFMGAVWYDYLKKKNDGHAYFAFQKVAMPIAPLIILSAVFYLVTR